MNSPQRQERRDVRYPLHMPVTLKLARQETHAQSQNISLRGILLSSPSRISEGSAVEVAVGVSTLPGDGVELHARGKVLRVQSQTAGDFAVAIEFEHPFELGLHPTETTLAQTRPRFPQVKKRIFPVRVPNLASAWHTET